MVLTTMVLTKGASGQCVDSKSKGFQLRPHTPKGEK